MTVILILTIHVHVSTNIIIPIHVHHCIRYLINQIDYLNCLFFSLYVLLHLEKSMHQTSEKLCY